MFQKVFQLFSMFEDNSRGNITKVFLLKDILKIFLCKVLLI